MHRFSDAVKNRKISFEQISWKRFNRWLRRRLRRWRTLKSCIHIIFKSKLENDWFIQQNNLDFKLLVLNVLFSYQNSHTYQPISFRITQIPKAFLAF